MGEEEERPLGVSILAALYGLGGLVLVVGGFGILVLGMFFASFGSLNLVAFSFVPFAWLSPPIALFAAIYMAVGILCFGLAYGLWNMREWAWWIVIVLSVLSILSGILGVGVTVTLSPDPFPILTGLVPLVIPVIILVYMYPLKDEFA